MELAGIPVPKMEWDSSNLPEAFKRFKQHIQLVFDGPLTDKDEAVKCKYFMLWIGDRGREIYNTWSVSEDDEKKLSTYYESFQSYIQPKLNPIFARYKFNNEVQREQSVEQFITRLRVLGKDCNYSDLDEMIRDRIVFGISNSKVREKLVNEREKLTMEKAITIAQQFEYAQEQMRSMSATAIPAESHSVRVTVRAAQHRQYVASRQQPQPQPQPQPKPRAEQRAKLPFAPRPDHVPGKKCGKCGYFHGVKLTCAAKGKQCNRCKQWNHFAKVCRNAVDGTRSGNAHAIVAELPYGEYKSENEPVGDAEFYVDTVERDNKVTNNQAFAEVELGLG
ncbi:PREDICTED: uncharacterized protein LOC106808905, partial [Priapulus caudatus]|uniref:Uncharacterized protein LOC106808905 n=1 Tax=Priapulus caudatus TaxID=37621 RepID=A0ABM1E535_PRICU